jgi:hypothetical protein
MPEPIPAAEPDFAAFIAIDWADREHVWSMQVAGSTRREKGKSEQPPEAIEAWAMQWAARFPGQPGGFGTGPWRLAVCAEQVPALGAVSHSSQHQCRRSQGYISFREQGR